VSLALDGPDRTRQGLGHLTFGKVFVEAQDQDGALPRGKSTERGDDSEP
jgi:hypothetical protein